MKLVFILCVIFLLNVELWGQKVRFSIDLSVKLDSLKTAVYKPEKKGDYLKTIWLKSKYGSAELYPSKELEKLKSPTARIISVDLVYTDVYKAENQYDLNKKRIAELYFLFPDIFEQTLIQWKLVEQDGYKNEHEATQLFHGFVIQYVELPTFSITTPEEFKKSIKLRDRVDTAFFKLFSKHFKGKSELIAIDMTGSMSPYYHQVFSWMYLKAGKSDYRFSFFNDGDSKRDNEKKMGNVGGVYTTKSANLDTLVKYAYSCIKGGGGGDTPENNIEAILKGIKKYTDVKEVILVADNYAGMRDYSMIGEVKVPVHVILCGTSYYGFSAPINTEYLDLARKTGGTISTIEHEIENLGRLKEGETVTFGGNTYVIRGGRFALKSLGKEK